MIEQEPRQREPSQLEVAAMIADQLGETQAPQRHSIEDIVKALGRTQARQLLNFALQAEEHSGVMVPDGSRRRTVGGVFFHYAYTIGIPKPGKTLQRPQGQTKKDNKQASQPQSPQKATQKPVSAPVVTLSWEDRIPIVKEAEQEKGTTSTVKITVVGRPGKILDKGQFIVTVMESTKVPSLPKGLPAPTAVATKYAVYISSKQWNKVAEAIKDPEDTLIIEGFPKADTEVTAIAVFATNVTTRKLQAGKRQVS